MATRRSNTCMAQQPCQRASSWQAGLAHTSLVVAHGCQLEVNVAAHTRATPPPLPTDPAVVRSPPCIAWPAVICNPLGKSGGALIQQFMIIGFGSLAASTPYLGVILISIIILWIQAAASLNKQFIALQEETGMVVE